MTRFHFAGGVQFDSVTGELRSKAGVLRLEPQPAAVLAALARRPGELVTHEELRQAVWGEAVHVKLSAALHYCVRQIRAALGDTAREPRYVETIPRRGYRMRSDAIDPAPPAPSEPRSRWALRIAVALMAAVAAAAIEQRPNNHHEIAVKIVRTLHDLVF